MQNGLKGSRDIIISESLLNNAAITRRETRETRTNVS